MMEYHDEDDDTFVVVNAKGEIIRRFKAKPGTMAKIERLAESGATIPATR